MTDLDVLRCAFRRRLTQDSSHRDRRRRDYNQAIFDPREGWAVFTGTDLGMVLAAFDAAVMDMLRKEATGHAER